MHVKSCSAKIHERLHFLRRFGLFGVSANIMMIFYRPSIELILRYGIASWFGNPTVKLKSQIAGLAKIAGKIMKMSTDQRVLILLAHCDHLTTRWAVSCLNYA